MELLKKISSALGVTHTQLAAMLLVSERSIYDWARRPVDELPPKGLRLLRLGEVVDELHIVMPKNDLDPGRMLAILSDGVVPITFDEDSGPMTLISYITAFPEDRGWRANVTAAALDYKDYLRSQKARAEAKSET